MRNSCTISTTVQSWYYWIMILRYNHDTTVILRYNLWVQSDTTVLMILRYNHDTVQSWYYGTIMILRNQYDTTVQSWYYGTIMILHTFSLILSPSLILVCYHWWGSGSYAGNLPQPEQNITLVAHVCMSNVLHMYSETFKLNAIQALSYNKAQMRPLI